MRNYLKSLYYVIRYWFLSDDAWEKQLTRLKF